jgi:hypothetical protein
MRRSEFAFVAILLLVSSVLADENKYRLSSKSFDVKNSSTKVILAEAHFRQPPQKVWELATQFESFPTFAPRFEKCELREAKGNVQKIFVHLDMPMIFPDIKAEMELTLDEAKKEFHWKLIQGNISYNVGNLWIESEKDGTFVKIGTQINPGSLVPQSFVAWAVRSYLPTLLEAFGNKLDTPSKSAEISVK